MKLIIFFGLPGAGKSYVGNIAEKYFGYHLYEGDQDLTPEMLSAIRDQSVITDEMRDVFFRNLLQSVKRLEATYENIAVAQTFIKEKYREQLLETFPQAKFFLVEAEQELRENRFRNLKDYFVALDYAKKMTDFFDKPRLKHEVIANNTDEDAIKEQLRKLLL